MGARWFRDVSVGPPLLEDSVIAAIFVDLESNLDREFCVSPEAGVRC